MIVQSETRSSIENIFITLFYGMSSASLCLLLASAKLSKDVRQNHFAAPNWHNVTFLHPTFNFQGHILSTCRVAQNMI